MDQPTERLTGLALSLCHSTPENSMAPSLKLKANTTARVNSRVLSESHFQVDMPISGLLCEHQLRRNQVLKTGAKERRLNEFNPFDCGRNS
jgi:hypothetical protein